ncbi:hypothetical protein Nepgr_018348 [Nepenthes gracilis]|uniref:Uncharacterized protein n=1 Tax=Nepenthes gracilis TaxID=150966 RepID=A0AAD3SSR2_NEPGR|nr:hypothetical protein Nepgr_018348 [Nepenthes gracilis]
MGFIGLRITSANRSFDDAVSGINYWDPKVRKSILETWQTATSKKRQSSSPSSSLSLFPLPPLSYHFSDSDRLHPEIILPFEAQSIYLFYRLFLSGIGLGQAGCASSRVF